MKILVTRTDRLGDVLMALPSLELIRLAFPDSEIDFLCPEILVPVIEPYLASRQIRGVSYTPAWEPDRGYTGALLLFPEIALLRKCASHRIPRRVGNFSKPASFLYLSGGRRQRRSKALKNEAEYNLDLARVLARKLGKAMPEAPPLVEIPAEGDSSRAALRELQTQGIGAGAEFVVLHPGMGGSALNLSAPEYLRMLSVWQSALGLPLLLSVGPAEQDQSLAASILREKRLPILQGLPLEVVREVFRRARWVIAPSTGPLHLAHYVGTKTLGIYPPVRSQSPKRWRPCGGTGKSWIVLPDLPCPGRKDCIGPSCREFFCMDRMDWRGLLLTEEGGLRAG